MTAAFAIRELPAAEFARIWPIGSGKDSRSWAGLPGAFRHAVHGPTDVYVMHRHL